MTTIHNIAHDVSTVLQLEYQSGDVNEIQINCANDAKIMVRISGTIMSLVTSVKENTNNSTLTRCAFHRF